jgi:N-acetylglutamate synthase-like GNAT family acetyltransferase
MFQMDDQTAVRELYQSGMYGHAHLPVVGECYAWYIKQRVSPEGDMSNVWNTYMCSGNASCFWVAEFQGCVVGCVGAVPCTNPSYGGSDCVELVRMIVSNECRNRSIGRGLLDTLRTWAIATGYRSIYLLTFSALEAPNALYRKCGFRLEAEEDFEVSDKIGSIEPAFVVVAHYVKDIP